MTSLTLLTTLFTLFISVPPAMGAVSVGIDLEGGIAPEHKLFAKLFKKYNNHIRPIIYKGEITKIFFELSLFDLLKLDTKNQVMVTNTEIIMKWWDHYLMWDPKDYNGTKVIRVPYQDVWYPDIILHNTADSNYEAAILNTNVIVYYNGEVELISHAIITSVCNVDVQWYPFDQQTCELVFAPWTHDIEQIQLIKGPADLSEYVQNPEFFLEDFYVKQRDMHNPCCKNPVSTVSYFIQLQRRTVFSLFFFIMPGILINVCALMVFSLPSETGEKVGLGINSMLAMMVFLMAMTENLPPTAKLPLAGVYYGSCITMITLNIAFSVTVLNLNVMGMRGYHVPEFLQNMTLLVARIILVKIPRIVRESWDLDNLDNTTTSTTPVVPFDDNIDEVTVFTVDEYRPEEKTIINNNRNNKIRSASKEKSVSAKNAKNDFTDVFDLQESFDYTDLKDPFQRRAVAALESINSILTREEEGVEKDKVKHNLVEQWKFVSRVMDRTLFITFTFCTIVFNLSILTSSPFGEKFAYCPKGPGECQGMLYEDIIALTLSAAHNVHFGDASDHGGDDSGGHGGGDSGGGHDSYDTGHLISPEVSIFSHLIPENQYGTLTGEGEDHGGNYETDHLIHSPEIAIFSKDLNKGETNPSRNAVTNQKGHHESDQLIHSPEIAVFSKDLNQKGDHETDQLIHSPEIAIFSKDVNKDENERSRNLVKNQNGDHEIDQLIHSPEIAIFSKNLNQKGDHETDQLIHSPEIAIFSKDLNNGETDPSRTSASSHDDDYKIDQLIQSPEIALFSHTIPQEHETIVRGRNIAFSISKDLSEKIVNEFGKNSDDKDSAIDNSPSTANSVDDVYDDGSGDEPYSGGGSKDHEDDGGSSSDKSEGGSFTDKYTEKESSSVRVPPPPSPPTPTPTPTATATNAEIPRDSSVDGGEENPDGDRSRSKSHD